MTTAAAPKYTDWRTYKANGVNLGSWFCLETFMVPKFFEQHSNSHDEWTACEKFNAAGAPLDEHYKTWFTKADVDTFAAQGINTLRIPFVYAAWINVPGSPHYHGPQVEIMKELATYAIEKYGMHIVLDLHALPGGVNWLEIGEAHGHGDWFYSEKNLNLSYQAVDAVLDFIQNRSGHPDAYTLAPVNEAVDSKDIRTFGTPFALSDKAADWLLKYILGVIERTEADSFKGEEFWSSRIPHSANVVFDVHIYYFAGRQCDPDTVLPLIEQDGKTANKTNKFPVVVGEWSIEMEVNNQLSKRKELFDAGRAAFNKYTQGNIYWSGRVESDAKIAGEGGKCDYWSYLHMIRDGVVTPWQQ
ncbi:glycoside hydrolase [Stemphylium lycopersici]|uniref:glucan 1,3-beta-glucosidase n=1 Tax=Stemphylium lycopersici TaxID=183478 RepID=A0A364MRW3_STELY|nr:beta-1,3-exoglucosidase [Stemphylium lycopersici]RAQ98752.1 glycoside hydrolase [Stemphylium lycopersici]RAR01121.1 glycoside hydrolase [Stemphylium lycopersici]